MPAGADWQTGFLLDILEVLLKLRCINFIQEWICSIFSKALYLEGWLDGRPVTILNKFSFFILISYWIALYCSSLSTKQSFTHLLKGIFASLFRCTSVKDTYLWYPLFPIISSISYVSSCTSHFILFYLPILLLLLLIPLIFPHRNWASA